mmetsp:Transcript_38695/g.121225  ORF Transcript_38695/g.121225 Transcript_38695/m.121225 type:complete len:219 (-) Transcript_38695:1136-1792(-)
MRSEEVGELSVLRAQAPEPRVDRRHDGRDVLGLVAEVHEQAVQQALPEALDPEEHGGGDAEAGENVLFRGRDVLHLVQVRQREDEEDEAHRQHEELAQRLHDVERRLAALAREPQPHLPLPHRLAGRAERQAVHGDVDEREPRRAVLERPEAVDDHVLRAAELVPAGLARHAHGPRLRRQRAHEREQRARDVAAQRPHERRAAHRAEVRPREGLHRHE